MNHDEHAQPDSPPPASPAEAPAGDGNLLSEQFRALDPRFIRAERIVWLIATGVAFFGGAIAVIIFLSGAGPIARLLLAVGWLLLVVILLIASFRIPPLVYRHMSWRATDTVIQIRRGVLWRSITDVPRSRIQHTDVEQGPLMRWCGIAKLVIHTAGARHATVDLPGLDRDEAFRLRDLLLEGTGDDER